MIKTILVPLDGSERAEYALPLAARIARHTGSMLVLVRVVNIATDYWPAITAPYSSSTLQAAVDGELQEATTYLERVAASTELARLKVITTAMHGAVAPIVQAAAIEYDADLIVMCSHGRTGVVHVIMGSVAEKIARHSTVPVLIIREKAGLPEMSPDEVSQPLRVLVPLDGSTHAEAVLEPAAELLTALAESAQKVAVHLVRVIEPPAGEKDVMHIAQNSLSKVSPYFNQTMELIREGSLAPEIFEKHIAVTWSVALDSDVARGVVRIAENDQDAEGEGGFGGCDLIAMSTHGRGGLQRLAMGSITERVLHSTKSPMLVVRPAEVRHTQGLS
jgi:nucleotide-binding universal stress UspA family protein